MNGTGFNSQVNVGGLITIQTNDFRYIDDTMKFFLGYIV